jgi:predicted DNA-binding transcriptional regulator YafY
MVKVERASVDRQRPAKDMLRLIQLLAAEKAFGMTLAEVMDKMEWTKRTTQRYLAALQDIEPDLSYHVDEDTNAKHWYLPSPRTRIPPVTAEQLSSLTAIAAFMKAQGHASYGDTLEDLRQTLQAGLDRSAMLRLDPDLEVLDDSVEIAHRPGPKASFDPLVRTVLLQAITTGNKVKFGYTNVQGRKSSQKIISPYALTLGPRTYLIARDESVSATRNYALTGIADLEVLSEPATEPDFDIKAFVSSSFGSFHDGIAEQWVLRFKTGMEYELSNYQFHPTQTMKTLDNGEAEVSFYCESMREVAYECLRWTESLTWVGPERLQRLLQDICQEISAACRD